MEDKFGLSHHKLEEKHVSSNISKRGFNPQRAQLAEIEKGKQVLNDATNGQLKKLEDKYLLSGKDNAPPIYKDSQIKYIIDGVDCFKHVDELIQPTRKGDTIFISALTLEPDFDLQGRPKDDPNHHELGDLLAEKAADGVDVRIILSSGWVMSSLPILKRFLGENLSAAEDLRARIPNNRSITTAPLDKRVIVDWTGARIGLNHQKSVVVSHQGKLTALVTGLDFKQHAYDQCPHDTLRIGKTRWGWHDAAALVTGPITESIWENFMLCWKEVSTLPKRYERVSGLKYELVNLHMLEEFSDAPKQTPINNPDVSMQTLRSFGEWKVGSLLPHRRSRWSLLPRQGIQEVYACFTKALQGASRYIYIEDQFLKEIIGGKSDYELYPFLKDAAERGVKVILLGSGVHGFIWKSKVSSRVSKDIQKKFLDQLKPTEQHNVAVHHLKHVQTHSKIVLVDDEFASVGSANMFSRSMAGIDHELNVALVTTGNQVRDLRVKLWGEHLRSSMDDPDYLNALRDQGIALGIWRPEWLPETESTETWRKAGIPKGFAPTEQVLKLVGPK